MLINTVYDSNSFRELDTLPASGEELKPGVVYHIYDAVNEYAFTAPARGWIHGIFHTGEAPNVTFTPARFASAAPAIEAHTEYEFDVLEGIWAINAVIAVEG